MQTPTRPLSPDAFHWKDDPVEDIGLYRPGGYHPVKLGDTFATFPTTASDVPSQPQYRVLHKLGHGLYSTVWLARDLLPPGRFVALKISVADPPPNKHEAQILTTLSQTFNANANSIGAKHIMTLLDNFFIQGPNGIHEALVTEVLAPLSNLCRLLVNEKLQRPFIHQALLGVSYLHRCGIAHGDLHIDNFGCTLPGLDSHTNEEFVLEEFGDPECWPVLTIDPSDQTASLPPYLIRAISLFKFATRLNFTKVPPSLKIMDFGNAFHKAQARPPTHCTVSVRAPETVFPSLALGNDDPEWDMRSDIWSLGCTIYEMVSGYPLFYTFRTWDLFRRMAPFIGHLPPDWASYWVESAGLRTDGISPAEADAQWASRRSQLVNKGGLTQKETEQITNLVRSMLVLDPEKRPSAAGLVELNSWLR